MYNTEHINTGGGLLQLIQYGQQDYWLMGEKMPKYCYQNIIFQTTPLQSVEPEDIIPTECVTTRNNLFEKELEQNHN